MMQMISIRRKLKELIPDELKHPSPHEIEEALFRLRLWRTERLTSFTAKLYDLLGKADPENRAKLGRAFPAEWAAWTLWHHCDDETALWAVLEDFPSQVAIEEEEHA